MDTSQPTKGELTRARIVDAALTVFLVNGFHGASIRQIVETAGITTGGLYNHFASKEELWRAVLLEKHPYREIIAAAEEAPGETVDAFVHAASKAVVRVLNAHHDVLKLMFIEMVEFSGRDIPFLISAIAEEARHLVERLESCVDYRSPFPLPLVVRAYGGLIFAYHATNLLLPDELKTPRGDAALDGFVDIFLYGIRPAEGFAPHD